MSNSISMPKDFQVTIVGGGIVGLACAIALKREGVPVQIYEATVCIQSLSVVPC